MSRILVIDDDPMIRDLLSRKIIFLGHQAVACGKLEEGRKLAFDEDFDVVLLDVNMPDGNGLDLLPALRQASSNPEIIIITGHGDENGAEIAIRSGAWDYIQKGTSMKNMVLPILRALEYRQEKLANRGPVMLERDLIIGESSAIKSTLDLVAQASASDVNVLITGETGVGKDLVARVLHLNGHRSKGEFVVVDCASLPDNLAQSTLFGHARGSFTGADRSFEGLVKMADQGTLFLDEVGELPMELQKAFLRVLQDRTFRPVGGDREISSDFRIVAATNRDLDEMVENGLFRRDLLFRLRTFNIEVPPLRERMSDVSLIAAHQVGVMGSASASGTRGMSPDFVEALTNYDWPGNVRELIHAVERAASVARFEQTLYPKHLPTYIRINVARKTHANTAGTASLLNGLSIEPGTDEVIESRLAAAVNLKQTADKGDLVFPPGFPGNIPPPPSAAGSSGALALPELKFGTTGFPDLKNYRDRAEIAYLMGLIEYTDGNVTLACKIAGMSRSRLYALFGKHGIDPRRSR
ncbi:MAG: Fis family transcriptional regulator [Candidatus Wallbacteria bacterium HGW-Wallbacteria-1]|jgi:two-component system NtrC family response regulator|uniref:Fis family transcriptional regulator n=1 Tax=Candidatus Wallbacteria bacterium HGW-Wallbacteria-1 TaxID=2013854 RepID=A0A2N1PNL9_9BACT|nr:MAG: Fis family transcriptional regulator [Candidatus Wallbacteria bacterium HGW-Wallbacteria-1]